MEFVPIKFDEKRVMQIKISYQEIKSKRCMFQDKQVNIMATSLLVHNNHHKTTPGVKLRDIRRANPFVSSPQENGVDFQLIPASSAEPR